MTHFDRLRTAPWYPTFDWVGTAEEAADRINVWHEDYPDRVERTAQKIESLAGMESYLSLGLLPQWLLFRINTAIFSECSFAGKARVCHVIVGRHKPPTYEDVPHLMRQLYEVYRGQLRSLEALKDWYSDFETIHPFQDGNGRVGGVIVAAYSHYLHPDKGYLAPNQ